MTARKVLALTCIIIVMLGIKMTAQHLKIKKLETQIAEIELQIQVKSLIDELRIPSEALYHDHKAARQIIEIRRQTYEKRQIKEFLPYQNVYVKPVRNLRELSSSSNVLGEGSPAYFGSPDSPEGSIYCPVPGKTMSYACLEKFWVNQINHSIGSLKSELDENRRLGKYYNEHPDEFEEVVKPWVLRITKSTHVDISLKACEILLKRGYRDEEIKEALRQMIEIPPSKYWVSTSEIKKVERLKELYKLELDLPADEHGKVKQE